MTAQAPRPHLHISSGVLARLVASMRPSLVLIALLALIPVAAAETFTNEDLEKEVPPDTFTNEDLDEAEGNLSFTKPEDDVSYENSAPWPVTPRWSPAQQAEIKKLQTRYRALLAREARIEDELPEAEDAAERELGPGVVIVNGIPTQVGEITQQGTPARYRLQELQEELLDIQAEKASIERTARKKYEMGFPGLVQD